MTNGQRILDFLIEQSGKDKISISFYPYICDMWDSMSSIFYAALNNDHVESVNVIPLLYTTAMFKKGFSRWYMRDSFLMDFYKGSEPDYSDYAIIHNPYDGINLITRVHYDYYSTELKKKCGKLVYIPYFYDPYGGCEAKAPGARNADYIFACTEAQRDFYIKNGKPASKVYSFGSPKIDGLDVNNECSDTGSVLLAGGLMCCINEGLDRVKKWQEVIDKITEEGRLIVFKPHPLTTQGVYAMKGYEKAKAFQEAFDEIFAKYGVRHGVPNNLIINCCSEAYLDPGSMQFIWQLTGKPYETI